MIRWQNSLAYASSWIIQMKESASAKVSSPGIFMASAKSNRLEIAAR